MSEAKYMKITKETIKRFNFTWAIPGGAWLEDDKGQKEWVSFTLIVRNMGQEWLDSMLKHQEWMTGCWVNC